ncbi:hypothetical protein ACFLWS_08625, partial [Chloroflexota bacterium]
MRLDFIYAQNASSVKREINYMKTILVEEHFMSPGFAEGPGRDFVENAKRGGDHGVEALEQLTDVDKKRIAAMDEAGIDMQVLSISSP